MTAPDGIGTAITRLQSSGLRGTDLLVAITIVHAGDWRRPDAPVIVSTHQIADRAGLSRSTVIEAIRRLTAAGVLVSDARAYLSSERVLVWDSITPDRLPITGVTGPRSGGDRQPVKGVTGSRSVTSQRQLRHESSCGIVPEIPAHPTPCPPETPHAQHPTPQHTDPRSSAPAPPRPPDDPPSAACPSRPAPVLADRAGSEAGAASALSGSPPKDAAGGCSMKPVDPLTAQTAGALMTSALERLRAQHGAPTPPPIPRPPAPVEVAIPDWLADDPTLPIPQRVGRTQLRIALAHGRVTLAELEAQRSPPAASASEPDRGLTATPDAQGVGAPLTVEPTPPAPPTDGDPLAADSAWLQGAGLLAQLQPGAAPLNPSTGAGAALLRALEREGDLVLRRLRYALTESSEGALRESLAAGDVSLGALVPARPSATTRRLDDGAARPVLRVIAGGRCG